MSHHKGRRPKNARSGPLCRKPWRMNGAKSNMLTGGRTHGNRQLKCSDLTLAEERAVGYDYWSIQPDCDCLWCFQPYPGDDGSDP